jgi:glycosyltransferase involved in cell wall biosynthesis
MRILFIVPYVPSPIRVRPYNLIKGLVARGHRLTLATLWTSQYEREMLVELESVGVHVVAQPIARWRSLINCLSALPTRIPLQAVFSRSDRLRSLVEQELNGQCASQPSNGAAHLAEGPRVGQEQPFDVVHVEHLRGAYYGLNLPRVPVVWDSVDCISYLFEQAARDSRSPSGRLMTRFDLRRTRRYEGWLVGQFERVLVTSQADRLALEELAAGSAHGPVTVLPNGVDLDYFTPGATRHSNTLVFTGKMSYHANVTAALYLAQHIMPLVWRDKPGVQLTIVGANPPRRVRRLAEQFPGQVEVTGSVPDLRPYLRQASVAVAPMRYGAGIQNKVLEAMACGAPVVATPQACAALSAIPGQHLLTGRDSRELGRAVIRLLDDPSLAARVGAAGRNYVEQCHDWGTVVQQLEGIYREATDAQRGRRPCHS